MNFNPMEKMMLKKIILAATLCFSSLANAYVDFIGLWEKDGKYVFVVGDNHTSMDPRRATSLQMLVEKRDTRELMSFVEKLKTQRQPVQFLLEASLRQRNEELAAIGDAAKTDGLLSTIMHFAADHPTYQSISFVESDRRALPIFMIQHVTGALNQLINLVIERLGSRLTKNEQGDYGLAEFDADLRRNPSVETLCYKRGGLLDTIESGVEKQFGKVTVAEFYQEIETSLARVESAQVKYASNGLKQQVLSSLHQDLLVVKTGIRDYVQKYGKKSQKDVSFAGLFFDHVRKEKSFAEFFHSDGYDIASDVSVFSADADFVLDLLESQSAFSKTAMEVGSLHAVHIAAHLKTLGYLPVFQAGREVEDLKKVEHNFKGSRFSSRELADYFALVLRKFEEADSRKEEL